MKLFQRISLVLSVLAWIVPGATAQVATGGTYSLQQSVIAKGGGNRSDPATNLFRVEVTAGQAAAGYNLGNGGYGVNSGFWTLLLAPTAADASITGRVVREDGLGLRNVVVTLMGGTLNAPRTVLTGSFGYFAFDEIEPGQIYLISVTSKRYGFAQPTQTIAVFGNVADLVFQASCQN
ncbi:MAG: carboxypeptidase-like regulatory domain-containing protein [Pyrinomonadaceae bacterium]